MPMLSCDLAALDVGCARVILKTDGMLKEPNRKCGKREKFVRQTRKVIRDRVHLTMASILLL
jgi:hypothetical protein